MEVEALPQRGTFALAVHIGAGNHASALADRYRACATQACKRATKEVLTRGGTATEAVVEAIRILEDDPLLNAGKGSNLTVDGTVECDAGLMDTRARQCVAVGAISGVKNPIKATHKMLSELENGLLPGGRVPPSFLAGSSAQSYFQAKNVEIVDPKDMITDASMARYRLHRRICDREARNGTTLAQALGSEDERMSQELLSDNHDTVGAVAIDSSGHLAAGVSSGGISLKHCGRIGEAGVPGAGCWAERGGRNSPYSSGVAVSCSGTGEQIIQAVLARSCAKAIQRDGGEDISEHRETVKAVLFESSAHIPADQEPALGLIALVEADGIHGGLKFIRNALNHFILTISAL